MLTSLSLGNFKSFGQFDCQARLSRLTVIVGPNTAGKSALLQSLRLLTQNAREPLDFSGEVDLGSYENVVHKHNTRSELRVGVGWDASTVANWDQNEKDPSEFIFDNTAPFFDFKHPRYSPYEELGLEMAYRNYSHPGGSRVEDRPRLAHCRYLVCHRPTGKEHRVNLSRPHHSGVSERSKRRLIVADSDGLKLTTDADIHDFITLARQVYRTASVEPTNYYVMDMAGRFRATKIAKVLQETLWLGKQYSGHSMVPTEDSTGLWGEFSELRPVLSGMNGMARSFQFICSCIRHVGPIRPRQERHQLARFAEYFVTQARKSSFQTISEEVVSDTANQVLSRLGIAYRLKMSEKYTRAAGLTYRCELIDQRTRTTINPIDTGSGISQILPLVAVLAVADRSVILVEQPELHLHPRLQAALAEEMARVPKTGPIRRQWLVETHSELFILRIQKLIRQGKLTSEDVSVLYVGQKQGSGSYIKQLRMDADGDFLDEWPDGFFEDGYRELFGADQ